MIIRVHISFHFSFCMSGKFRGHEIFGIFAIGLILHSRNNHCYTVCVDGHHPLGQHPRKLYP